MDSQESEGEAPDDSRGEDGPPELRFDHNVIEHLGIKLYQNKPVNVLAELVANCWDADARHVWIDSRTVGEQPMVSVGDDGAGMPLGTLKSRYLVIGKAKRASPKDKSPGGRLPMGRKGIGKLAPFGVSRIVEVATVSGGVLNWFTLSLDDLLALGRDGLEHRYRPIFHASDVPAAPSCIEPTASPAGPEVARFMRRMGRIRRDRRSGTLVVMYGLTANAPLSSETLIEGLGSRFSVVLLRPDFKVRVGRRLITEREALPAFDVRFPASGFETAEIGGRPVRWWAGFVLKADWPSDQAGVGVFAHGKIAQDRPFFFGAKGKEIYQRYLYGVVEADWLDELDQDLVSTDRTSIDWSDTETADLLSWGRQQVGSWLESYTQWRAQRLQGEVRTAAARMRTGGRIPVFSELENEAIVKLVTDASGQLGKGSAAEKAREDLLDVVSKAWINQPTRLLLKETWRDMSGAADDPEKFAAIAKTLGDHSVPEAMGLALTFALRAFAVAQLEALIAKKSETRLQALVEEFPWIIQPRGELLTADQWLKTTIERIADEDTSGDRAGRTIREMSPQERADFVFLTSTAQQKIKVVEIKQNDPLHALNLENRRQLADYLDLIETERSTADVTGMLIGWAGNPKFNARDERIEVRGWDEILAECRAAYLELLAGALEQADLDAADTRMKMVREFGGPKVWNWLKRMAEKDRRLAVVMERVVQATLPIPQAAGEQQAAARETGATADSTDDVLEEVQPQMPSGSEGATAASDREGAGDEGTAEEDTPPNPAEADGGTITNGDL